MNQPTNSTNRKSTATFGSVHKGTKKGISSKKGGQKSKDTSKETSKDNSMVTE